MTPQRLMSRRRIETDFPKKHAKIIVLLPVESRDTFKHLTVLRDASTLGTVGAGLTAGF